MDERVSFLLTSVEISILGGISNWLMSDEKKWISLFINIFIAGFVGLLVGELCLHYKLAESWSYFIAGSSGLSAETLLVLFKKSVILRLESLLESDSKEKAVPQLGDLLKERFGVSESDLEKALTQQKIGKMRIGEILVSNGIITKDTLNNAIQEQIQVSTKAKRGRPKKKKTN